MLDKNKNSNKISFLDSFFENQSKEADTQKEPEKQKTSPVELKTAKKLNNEEAIETRGGDNKILSSHQGTIKGLLILILNLHKAIHSSTTLYLQSISEDSSLTYRTGNKLKGW